MTQQSTAHHLREYETIFLVKPDLTDEGVDRVKDRVGSMHAADRYRAEGTIEDLRKEEDSVGYAKRLRHGVIGKGLNNYDKIFGTLANVGFHGWISIEDGVNGMEELHQSVAFLRKKINQYWPK